MPNPIGPDPGHTVGDAVRARQTRLVVATRYAEQHPGLSDDMRARVAAWISTGGHPPWTDRLATGGQTYPPQQPEGDPHDQ
jgi:hypothetical protein